jgi:hypothetical protein
VPDPGVQIPNRDHCNSPGLEVLEVHGSLSHAFATRQKYFERLFPDQTNFANAKRWQLARLDQFFDGPFGHSGNPGCLGSSVSKDFRFGGFSVQGFVLPLGASGLASQICDEWRAAIMGGYNGFTFSS